MLLHAITSLDWVVFSIIFAATIGSTIFGAIHQSKATNVLNYWLMGRRLTLPFFVTSLVCTWYGGIFAVTQTSFVHGIYNFISQGFVWYIGYIFFALVIVPKINRIQAITLPELMQKRYGVLSGKLTAILLIFEVMPVAYAISIGAFLSMLFDMDFKIATIVGTMVVAGYSCFGGMRSLIMRDIIQFIIMYAAVISVLVVSYCTFGGFDYLQSKLEPHYFSISGKHGISAVFLWFITALITTLTSPLFYQRCIATQSPIIAKKGIMISIFFWFICDVSTTLGGMYAKAHMPQADSLYAYILYSMEILPDGMRGLMIAGVVAVILSTLDAFLFIASSIFAYDLVNERMRESKRVRQLSIIVCGIITIVIAINWNDTIESAWIYMKIYFTAPLVAPLLITYIAPNYKITDYQCVISILFSIICVYIAEQYAVSLEHCFYIGIGANAVALALCCHANAIMPKSKSL